MKIVAAYLVSLFISFSTMAFGQRNHSFSDLTRQIFFLPDSIALSTLSATLILEHYQGRSDLTYINDKQHEWNLNMAVWNMQTHTFLFDDLKDWIFKFSIGSIDVLMSDSEDDSLVVDEIRTDFVFSEDEDIENAYKMLVTAFSACSTKQNIKKDRKLGLVVAEFSNEHSNIRQISIIKRIKSYNDASRRLLVSIGNDLE